jgi:L-ascorbate metabolism protein UlaG (beta-lactamase superfamily)
VAFIVTLDEVTVAHLGDPAEPLPQAALEELGRAQVLLLPVGGHAHLSARAAAKVVATLEPRLVIPMLYAVEAEREALDGVEPFLRELGASRPEALENHINVSPGSLPATTTVQVLAPRGE